MSDLEELQAGLAHILGSPRVEGRLEMVVRRPAENEQEVLAEARIESGRGMVGDRWISEPKPSPEAEVTLMNARCVAEREKPAAATPRAQALALP